MTDEEPSVFEREIRAMRRESAVNPFEAPRQRPRGRVSGTDERGDGFPLAEPGDRLIARLLDGMFITLGLLPALLADVDRGSGAWAILGMFTVLGVLIVQWHMLSTSGQTIGKRTMSLVIVRTDHGPPDFATMVVVRSWLFRLLGMLPGFSLVDALFILGDKRQCIHDRVAGTRVVKLPPGYRLSDDARASEAP